MEKSNPVQIKPKKLCKLCSEYDNIGDSHESNNNILSMQYNELQLTYTYIQNKKFISLYFFSWDTR